MIFQEGQGHMLQAQRVEHGKHEDDLQRQRCSKCKQLEDTWEGQREGQTKRRTKRPRETPKETENLECGTSDRTTMASRIWTSLRASLWIAWAIATKVGLRPSQSKLEGCVTRPTSICCSALHGSTVCILCSHVDTFLIFLHSKWNSKDFVDFGLF